MSRKATKSAETNAPRLPLGEAPVRPTFKRERAALKRGVWPVAGCDCEAVISGDALVLSIAAASIVAKVARDRLMAQVGAAHPGYGFERHMGYSVPEHADALTRLGPTVHHRRSFAPVALAYGNRAPGAAEAVALPFETRPPPGEPEIAPSSPLPPSRAV